MAPELQIHPVQAQILRVLLFKPTARFSDLNTAGISSDHFTFHVKRLLEAGLIEKNGDAYRLTMPGKEFANRFDVDETMKIERQAKLGALVCPVREVNGIREYLLQQRLKQPYYGYYGLLGGKIKWGETLPEAAARELKEEAGLTADLTLLRIKHKMDYDQEGKCLEDKYFFVFRADSPRGELIEKYEGGLNVWLDREAIAKLDTLFPDVIQGLDAIDGNELVFNENKYVAEGY